MADFLLELLSEEIPARMQAGARNELAQMLALELDKVGASAEAIDVHSTPRRLALIARGLPLETEPSREELKGPRVGAPPQALGGFLRKTGLAQEQLEERNGVYFAVKETPGRPMVELLGQAVERIVREFSWPKSMRWGSASRSTGSLRWVRPLHGIVAMLGEKIVPVSIDGIDSGATTVGHRFHHPGAITIGGAQDYAEKLRACHVIVDQDEREKLIREGAGKVAAGAGLQLVCDEGLVVENAGLTEWPVPLLGRFDPDYLDVPSEVIVLTMRTNQKYFACIDEDGALAPAFVCVANIDSNDGGQAIVEGNRRVLAARLADARFFWEQDLKVPLERQAEKLSGIVFHEKLGTVADKVERVANLARWLVEEGVVQDADPDQVERAARLAKADLVTGMVGEFPELQGVIGGYLARAQGETNAIADAVRDHYKPVGQGDEVPTASMTVAVALADKLDTLVSFFAVDEKPTGSKDPYGLRRAALAVLKIVLSQELRLSLGSVVEKAYRALIELPTVRPELLVSGTSNTVSMIFSSDTRRDGEFSTDVAFEDGVLQVLVRKELRIQQPDGADLKDVKNFMLEGFSVVDDTTLDVALDRLKVQQREAGVRHDLIDAVFALGGEDDLVRLLARVKALQSFVETEDGADLLTAYKRAANILKKEEWTGSQIMSSAAEDGIPQTGEEDPLVLVEEPGIAEAVAEMAAGPGGAMQPEERALIDALDEVEPKATAAVEAEDFTEAMAALAALRGPIDSFFDNVTVNDPDPAKRERRLNLLLRFRDAVHRVADFSRIEG